MQEPITYRFGRNLSQQTIRLTTERLRRFFCRNTSYQQHHYQRAFLTTSNMEKSECVPFRQPCEFQTDSPTSSEVDYVQDCFMEENWGNLYIEIMQVCQPFYALPTGTGNEAFRIPPRLEDGLNNEKGQRASSIQENPQDPMAAYFRCASQTFSGPASNFTSTFHGR